MSSAKMHAEEVDTDVTLVRRLLAAQFPQWTTLPLSPVPSGGTDNAIYRLGDAMAVRLPRVPWTVAQVKKEQHWLPYLAPLLPLAIPLPLAMGKPSQDYPWEWSVYRWLEGENVSFTQLVDPGQTAIELANFVLALQRIPAVDGPPAGPHNFGRGVPLAMRDADVRKSLASLQGIVDTKAATAAWESALHAPAWQDAPVWLHGDLQSGNLLCVKGRLHAVIDFGGLGVGDPACDLMVAWNFFSAEAREVYRMVLQVEEATWARGRGWALSVAINALAYYLHTSPSMVNSSQHTIAEVLAEGA